MKTALTFIFGNNADILPRFLENFKGLADIMVGVRAVGKQTCDESWKIAEDAGCIVLEYYNKKDWPHVDDFAEARNRAISMAKYLDADWLIWADTDDVISPESVEALREAIRIANEKPDVVGLQVPYKVPEDGVTVMRERAWRSGSARWQWPIHECLKFDEGAKLLSVPDCLFVHAAKPGRKSHDERNLRILESIPVEDRTLGQRFHVFQSQRALGKIEESIQTALALVQEPEIGTPEKYELLIALGQLAEDKATRVQFLLQAALADPTRREALGELSLVEIGEGNSKNALAWCGSMLAQKQPPEWAWNARRKYYEWLGVQLNGMALRQAGSVARADVEEMNWFLAHDGSISLIHATRGRPSKAWEARKTWLERANNANRVEHIFGLDADDKDSAVLAVGRHVWTDGKGGPVAAWNAAAMIASGRLLVQLSDDWLPPFGWDDMLLAAVGERLNGEAVVAISDGARTDDLLCMAILTKERWKKQGGFMFHPAFFSMYSDNWFSHCAFRDGVVIDKRDSIVFEHLHPAFGKANWDDTYLRSNAKELYDHGQLVYEKLMKAEQ